MTVNHDVVGSSPTGGVCKRSKERFFICLSGIILILFLFGNILQSCSMAENMALAVLSGILKVK